jgi:hypothetical protein
MTAGGGTATGAAEGLIGSPLSRSPSSRLRRDCEMPEIETEAQEDDRQ